MSDTCSSRRIVAKNVSSESIANETTREACEITSIQKMIFIFPQQQK